MSVTVSRTCAIELAVMPTRDMLSRHAGIDSLACPNRPRARSDDDACDGAGLVRGRAAGLGPRHRRRPVRVVVLGERITFDNPEALTPLGALVAWTDRLPLVTTVIVPQLRNPVMLAKAGAALGSDTSVRYVRRYGSQASAREDRRDCSISRLTRQPRVTRAT
jgi:hypothetical protein